MGLFGFKSKGKTNGNYKLNTLTQGEKNAVLQRNRHSGWVPASAAACAGETSAAHVPAP